MKQTFRKYQKVTSKKDIELLFHPVSDKEILWPIRLIHVEKENKESVKVLLSVPIKKYPLAVHRNKIKRLMKESIRKHLNLFKTRLNNKSILCCFMYIHEQIITQKQMDNCISKCFEKLEQCYGVTSL